MNFYPILLYGVFVFIYTVVEWIVFMRNRLWKRQRQKDCTIPIIVIPFKTVMVAPILEYLYCKRSPSWWGYAIGGILFVLATVLRTKGHLDLKQGFTPYIEKLEGQKLVNKGIYKYIRHPLYLAIICLVLACPIFLYAYYSLIFTVLTILGLLVRIRKEEKFLKIHMMGYSDYIKGTWALIPKIY